MLKKMSKQNKKKIYFRFVYNFIIKQYVYKRFKMFQINISLVIVSKKRAKFQT